MRNVVQQFKDGAGRSWTIAITCGSLKRIEANAGFDFADISNGKAVEMFSGNHREVMAVLWPLVKVQADSQNITPDMIEESLWGEPLEDAIRALRGALLDFFPPSRRVLVAKLLTKMDEAVTTIFTKAEADILKDIEGQSDTPTGGTSHTDAPESLESIPMDGPSES